MTPGKTLAFFCDVRPLEDPALFERLFCKADPERQRRIEALRRGADRQLSLAGGLLLDFCLRTWGVCAQVAHSEQGRPFVPGHPAIHLSLTHCYPYAAALISRNPCGVDIERQSERLLPIMRRYYTAREQSFCAGDPSAAAVIWCRKECGVKCGHSGDIRAVDTFAIPEDYRYTSIRLDGCAFELLTRDEVSPVTEIHPEAL